MKLWVRFLALRNRLNNPDDRLSQFVGLSAWAAIIGGLVLSSAAKALGAESLATVFTGVAIVGVIVWGLFCLIDLDTKLLISAAVAAGVSVYIFIVVHVAIEIDGLLAALMIGVPPAILWVSYQHDAIRHVHLGGAILCVVLLLFPPWTAYADYGARHSESEQGRALFSSPPKLTGDCVEWSPVGTIRPRIGRMPGGRMSPHCLTRGNTIGGLPLALYRVRIDSGRLSLEILIAVAIVAALTIWNRNVRPTAPS